MSDSGDTTRKCEANREALSWRRAKFSSRRVARERKIEDRLARSSVRAIRIRVEKSLHLCLAGLRIWWFDPIAEASELPDHSCGAPLLGLFGDGWAPFFEISRHCR